MTTAYSMIGVYKWLYLNFEQVGVDESAEDHKTDTLFLELILYSYYGILALLVLMQIIVFICACILLKKLKSLLKPTQQQQDALLLISEDTLERSV